jgi:hypothetical protein
MNFASFEFCKELYEQSHWLPARCWYWVTTNQDQIILVDSPLAGGEYPAYTLGYLLRKLPELDGRGYIQLTKMSQEYQAVYAINTRDDMGRAYAESPEDAAAKLAIELFKQGILTKDTPHAK